MFPASVFSARAREAAELEKLRQEKGITKYGPIKDPTDPDKLIKAPAISDKKFKEARLCPEFSTAAEAQAHLGFPVHLPEYLPKGYQLASMSGDRWEKSGGFVNIHYRAAGESQIGLSLMITDEPNFLKGGDEVKENKLGEKTAYWSEFPIMELAGEGKEPAVRTGHMLKWEDNGLVYTLRDNGQLSQEEMLRIAASINAKPSVEKEDIRGKNVTLEVKR